jgi:hypothetical protein
MIRGAAILEKALEVRDRRDAGTIMPRGVQVVGGQLQAKMNRLLEGHFTNAENPRFAKHLRNCREALFVFLRREDVEATNWRGEYAMRAGIMTHRRFQQYGRTSPRPRFPRFPRK